MVEKKSTNTKFYQKNLFNFDSYQLIILGGLKWLIILYIFAFSQHKWTLNVQSMFEPLWKNIIGDLWYESNLANA